MRTRLRWPGLLFLCSILGSLAIADEEQTLEAIRRSVAESRDKVERYREEERGLLEALDALDRREALLLRDAASARTQAENAKADLRGLGEKHREIRDRLKVTRKALASRAVALYKLGEIGPVRALFGAGNFESALSEVRVLQHLVRRDERLIASYNADVRALEETRVAAAAALESRDEAAARLEVRRSEVEADRAVRRRLLASVRKDRDRERGALRELEAAARELEEKLGSFDSGDYGGAGFVAQRGSLPTPVEAPVIAGFGRVRDEFATETFHKGLLFEAERGAPVFAIANGEVRYAGWFRGYGRLLIVDHGEEYFTVTGHLDAFEVEVDEPVRAGQVIGRVGESGSLAGPRLYFEIRHRQEAQDPALWLAPRLR